MFARINNVEPELYHFPNIDDLGFKTFLSGRGGGASHAPFDSLNTDVASGDDPLNVEKNMTMIKEGVGVNTIWAPRQVHGDNIELITNTPPDRPTEADATITNVPGLAIAVRTADCLPVILADPVTKTIVAIHAGRKGTELSIVSKTVERVETRLGANAKNIHVALGPCIRRCCYEVDEATAQNFHNCCGEGEGRMIDILSANIRQLISAGVKAEKIYDCGICTACENDRFFSYRKDGRKTGRFMSSIAII